MRAVEVLRAEHDGVLTVLVQLERAARAAAHGAPVPADVFSDIQGFFAVFVDRCHHGKEEAEIFPRLGQHKATAMVQALELEHQEGRRLAAAYADAARAYVPGNAASGGQLARAAQDYAALLRAHIERETRDLFPAIEGTLAAEDSRLVTAFDRIENEQIGAGTHEHLHAMIETLPGRIAPWVEPPATTG
ncbi:MAG: hemerythrin domain-containing protein [Chloroflexi bacterium]|nr:hemerythrin domain-containing protein [Chloroflexota bacterium]